MSDTPGVYPQIIKHEGYGYYVLSEDGQVLGLFNTPEAADKFKSDYSAEKEYSSNLHKRGSDEAMDIFLKKTRGY